MAAKKFKGMVLVAAATILGALAAKRAVDDSNSERIYALIDIDSIGANKLNTLKQTLRHEWFVEADDKLLVLTTPTALAQSPWEFEVLPVIPSPDNLYMIRMAHSGMLETMESELLVKGGRQAVVQARTGYLESRLAHPSIRPFVPNIVLARQSMNDLPLKQLIRFPLKTHELLGQIDGQRWLRNVEVLAEFNRYTHGKQILEARDYLVRAFNEIEGLEVSTVPFLVGASSAYNVVAKLRGTSRPDDWIIVGAHYDAISERSTSSAPGAEDNASGTAGLLELAQVLSAARPAASVFFVAFSGEEQGLYGGHAHAKGLVDGGDKNKVKAVINMDMIGYSNDEDFDCLLESDQRGASLFPVLTTAAQEFTKLRVVTSLYPWGSDHVPFIQRGMPAVLTIENDWDDYPAYHHSSDTSEKLSMTMAEEILKMNAAAILQIAGG